MDADLYAAATGGNVDDIMKLREKIGQVTERNHDTILHLAALSSNSTCVDAILDEFPSLLCRVNSRNETALHLAAGKGYNDVVEVLINKSRALGADNNTNPGLDLEGFIRKVNVDLDTALHLAVRKNHNYVVKLVVEADPSDEHSQNHSFESPLYSAAIAGYLEIIKTIFRHCTNPGIDGPEGRTALHAAVIRRSKLCTGVILKYREDLFQRVDSKGWTAFHYAASLNCVRELDELIRLGNEDSLRSSISKRSSTEKKTALHIAAYEGHIYVLTRLMESCRDACDTVDEDGRNILHIAAEQNHKELIQSILQDFPDVVCGLVKMQDENGNTPLHLLVIAGCYVPRLITHQYYSARYMRNNDTFTPQELLYLDEDIVADQLMIKNAFEDNQVNQAQIFWHKVINWGLLKQFTKIKAANRRRRVEESLVRESKRRRKDAKFQIAKTKITKEEVELYRERTSTQIIVTALITTVTFTVGFTMPGGNYDGGDVNEGLAILSKKTAFIVCMLADTIGLLFSTSSLFLYFISSLYQDPNEVSRFIAASTAFNIVSVLAMMLTFISGTYVVLSNSPGLAIAICAISCIFFLLLIIILIKLMFDPKEKFKV